MADLNDFLPNGGGGGFQIGAIVAAATTVTEAAATLLPCDGSEYLASDYPLLMARIKSEYTKLGIPLIGSRAGGALTFTPEKVEYSADKTKLYAWNRTKIAESVDHGVTWSGERDFNVPIGTSHTIPVKAVLTDRMLVVETAESATSVVSVSRSDDFGLTWTNVTVQTGGVSHNYRDLIVARDGLNVVLFGDDYPISNTTVVACRSTDGGVTFGGTNAAGIDVSMIPWEGSNHFVGDTLNIFTQSGGSYGLYSRSISSGGVSNSAYFNTISPNSHTGAWFTNLPDGSGLLIANPTNGLITKWTSSSNGEVIGNCTGLGSSQRLDRIALSDTGDMLFNSTTRSQIIRPGESPVDVYGTDVLFQAVGGEGFVSELTGQLQILTADETYPVGATVPYSFIAPLILMSDSGLTNAEQLSMYNKFLYIVGDEQP